MLWEEIIVLNEQSTEMTRSQIYLEFQSQRVTKILTASNFFKKKYHVLQNRNELSINGGQLEAS